MPNYYQYNEKMLQKKKILKYIKVFIKKKNKRSVNMVVSNTKI